MTPSSGQAPALSAFEGNLAGVSADSGTDAWAVGSLILHWNGRKWSEMADPAKDADLVAVKAVSPANVWAVGSYCGKLCGPGPQANLNMLILHWNGKTWSKAGPIATAGGSFLNAVTATSATNAWAVGDYYTSTAVVPVILHWNGKAWSKVPSPAAPANASSLDGVTATSPANAWAVGSYTAPSGNETLVLHWNGKSWSKVASPNTGGGSIAALTGVTATSATNAWAVGTNFTASDFNKTLILHWNGKTWSTVTSPNPGGAGGTTLTSVTATSPISAWAVGHYDPNSAQIVPDSLILHWNGKTWSKVTSPNPGGTSGTTLTGVSATSGTSAWAVGNYSTPSFDQYALELRWNGKTWARA